MAFTGTGLEGTGVPIKDTLAFVGLFNICDAGMLLVEGAAAEIIPTVEIARANIPIALIPRLIMVGDPPLKVINFH
jgi:hypothetical protein